MKYVLLSIIMLFTFNLNVLATKNTPTSFVKKYELLADSLSNVYKIPTSVILGVSFLESGYGTSKLSVNKNNFFGVKKGNYYRYYNSDYESFEDFCKIISRKKYYKSLVEKDVMDYKTWLYKIQSGGYSQTPTWPNKIINIINRHKLNELDK